MCGLFQLKISFSNINFQSFFFAAHVEIGNLVVGNESEIKNLASSLLGKMNRTSLDLVVFPLYFHMLLTCVTSWQPEGNVPFLFNAGPKGEVVV